MTFFQWRDIFMRVKSRLFPDIFVRLIGKNVHLPLPPEHVYNRHLSASRKCCYLCRASREQQLVHAQSTGKIVLWKCCLSSDFSREQQHFFFFVVVALSLTFRRRKKNFHFSSPRPSDHQPFRFPRRCAMDRVGKATTVGNFIRLEIKTISGALSMSIERESHRKKAHTRHGRHALTPLCRCVLSCNH